MTGTVAHMPEAAAAAPPPLEAAEPPAPRRLTAARLFSALRKDTRFAEIVLFQDRVSYGAEAVLKAVCGLVAASPEPGVYRPPPSILPEIPAVIGHKLRKVRAEADVGRDLEALIAAGLVLEAEGGGLALPIDVEALEAPAQPRPKRLYSDAELAGLTAQQRASVLNGKKGGRPRRGAEGQRELAVHGVVGGTQAETRHQDWVSETGWPVAEPGGDPGFEGIADAEAAAAEDDVPSSEQQLPGAHEHGNPEAETQPETRQPMPRVAAGGSELMAAAGRVARALGLSPSQMRAGDQDLVAGWIGRGVAVDRLVDIAAARLASNEKRRAEGRKVRPIGSLAFLDPAVQDEIGHAPAATAPRPARTSESPISPTIARLHRPWMDSHTLFQVNLVGKAMEAGDVDMARSRFERVQRLSGRAAGLCREAYPELVDSAPLKQAG